MKEQFQLAREYSVYLFDLSIAEAFDRFLAVN